MREVTTLKQLMLDAARYRWARDNLEHIRDYFLMRYECHGHGGRWERNKVSAELCDQFIDEILDRE